MSSAGVAHRPAPESSRLLRARARARATVSALPGSLRFGLGLLAAAVVFAFVVSLLTADPNEQDLVQANLGPSAEHPFGTDPLGRDVLAWTAGGIFVALRVSLSVIAIASVLGVVAGIAAGYFRGLTDGVLMRLADLQLAIPPLLLFIAASVAIPRSTWSLILLICAVGWVPYARTVRARIGSERTRGFVAAARLAGTGHVGIMIRHLLPTAATLILVVASLQVGAVLLWESALSFLSLGVKPPETSLGFMIAQGRTTLVDTWWVVVFPGLALVLLVVAANLIGDGLRDLLNEDVQELS